MVFYEDVFPFHRSEVSSDAQSFFPHIGSSSHTTEATASDCNPAPVVEPIRRISKPPSHLQDYHCYAIKSSTEHPISNVVSYAALSDPYMIFINLLILFPSLPHIIRHGNLKNGVMLWALRLLLMKIMIHG